MLDDDCLDRPTVVTGIGGERLAIKAFTSQGHQYDPANVGMSGQCFHHRKCVIVGIATRKADQLDAWVVDFVDDPPRDVVRALDQIHDQNGVADALTTVTAQPAAHLHVTHE